MARRGRKGKRTRSMRKLLRSGAFINAVARARNPEKCYLQYDLAAKTVADTKAANPVYWYLEGVIGTSSYMKNIIETAGQSAATDADTDQRVFHIWDNKLKMMVKNNEVNPVNLECYFCTVRDRGYESTTQTGRDSLQEMVMYDLVQGWSQLTSTTSDGYFINAAANTDLWDAGDTEFHTSYPFFTPFQSRNFCSAYKVNFVKRIRLAPGEAIFLRQVCKSMDWHDAEDDAGSKAIYPGITKFILVKQCGDLGTTAADTPGYTLSQVIWEKTYTAKWNQKQDTDRQLGVTNNVTLPADGTAVLGPTDVVMDDV